MTAIIPDGWKKINRNSTIMLSRVFTFDNFSDAMTFATKVGEMADLTDHHPEITISWGRVQVLWWSHDANGITDRDKNSAQATEELFLER